MKKPFAAFAFTVAAALACAGLTPVADADPPPQAPPLKLTDAKKMESFANALKNASLPAVATVPPAAHFSLTPSAPTNNGAQIATAGPLTFMMSQASGTYMVQPSGAVTMTIPTEPNKTYVMDCSVTYSATVGLSVLKTTPVPSQRVPADSGHVVWAFRASTASSAVRLETVGPHALAYFGCDVTRME
jgi:hypothetical protein